MKNSNSKTKRDRASKPGKTRGPIQRDAKEVTVNLQTRGTSSLMCRYPTPHTPVWCRPAKAIPFRCASDANLPPSGGSISKRRSCVSALGDLCNSHPLPAPIERVNKAAINNGRRRRRATVAGAVAPALGALPIHSNSRFRSREPAVVGIFREANLQHAIQSRRSSWGYECAHFL